MPLHPRMSLRTKFILAVGLLIGLVVALVIILVSRNMRVVVAESTMKRAVAVAQIFGSGNNLTYLKLYNFQAIQQNAETAQRDGDLSYVIVYSKEGIFAANTETPSLMGSTPQDPSSQESIRSKQPLIREISVFLPAFGDFRKVLDVSVPVTTPESPGRWGTVRLGFPADAMHERIREIQMRILVAGLVSLIVGILGARFLADRITIPLSQIVQGALKAASGDLSHRIKVDSGDELEGLAANFNYMMDQIKLNQEERIRAEKMAAVGSMMNAILHDCRAPMTVIKGFASVLRELDVPPEQFQYCLGFIDFEIDRMERMLDDILQFSTDKVDSVRRSQINLNDFLENCSVEIEMLFKNAEITFVRDIQANATVSIDQDKFRRALLNIAANAKDAMKGKGTFTLAATTHQEQAVISLSDSGSGIPEDLQIRIFEPYFTHGKAKGFGLGMSITKRIIDDHHGKIVLESQAGQGTSFHISIPVVATPQSLSHAHSA